jgi:hypothetical protein
MPHHPNWAHLTRPDEKGRFEDRKIDNSGGGLIKSAFARFLERLINGQFRKILKIRHFGPIWGELGPLMTPFGVNLAILG